MDPREMLLHSNVSDEKVNYGIVACCPPRSLFPLRSSSDGLPLVMPMLWSSPKLRRDKGALASSWWPEV
jgi:hypothetical protein